MHNLEHERSCPLEEASLTSAVCLRDSGHRHVVANAEKSSGKRGTQGMHIFFVLSSYNSIALLRAVKPLILTGMLCLSFYRNWQEWARGFVMRW